MKNLQTFTIRESSNSPVFLTKANTTDPFFEEKYSPFLIVRVGEDIANIFSSIRVLEERPFLEKVSFYSNAAFLLPKYLFNQMSQRQRDLFYARIGINREEGEGCIQIEDIDVSEFEPVSLSFATLKRSEEEYELCYEGLIESFERTHVQSGYFPLELITHLVENALVG